jgi:4-amino-4-deoxy-L-arabinose transferase-like glycosyltransferase
MKSSMRHYDLLAVLTLAAALRFLLLLLWLPELTGDEVDYDRLARSLIDGRGYINPRGEPTSSRPPLYPAFVAAGYALTGGTVQAVRFLQATLDLGTVALTYLIGRWLFGRGPGLLAALLISVNLGTVAATGRLLSETLFTFLLMATVAVTVRWLWAMREGRVQAVVALGIGTGVLLGAGTLTKGVFLLYTVPLIVLAAWTRWVHEPASDWVPSAPALRKTTVRAILVVPLTFALVLTPWTLRNYRVHGAFVPVATQIGLMLYASYNPPEGVFGLNPSDEVTAAAERLSEPEASAALVRAAVDTIHNSPGKALRLEALKVLYFWVPLDWEILPFYGAFNPPYAFIAIWSLFYLALRWPRETSLPTWPAWLPILYFFGMALLFQGSPRYRLPVEPLLALFAAAGLVTLDRRVGRRTSVALAGGTMIFFLLVCAFAEPLKQLAKGWIFGLR